MDERLPILPPPPSFGLAVWASLNAMWFRLARAARRARSAVRAARRLGTPAYPGRISAFAPLEPFRHTVSIGGGLRPPQCPPITPGDRPTVPIRTPRNERPTAVERRPG